MTSQNLIICYKYCMFLEKKTLVSEFKGNNVRREIIILTLLFCKLYYLDFMHI